MAKRSEILQELANKQKDVEAIQAEMEQKEKDMKNAWLEQQPIRDHDDIVKDYAEVAKLNLTDARDGLSNYPKRYQIEGKDIPALIKEMRKFRRTLKGETKVTFTNSIDNLIKDYSGYLEKCIDSIYWIKKYKKPLKQMNYNEDKLIKLNSIHSAKERREIIDVLCKYWEAEQDIRGLPYGKEYSRLNKEMKTLKKQFTQLLKQTPISNSPKDSIRKAILDSVCETPGISSREIHDSLPKNLYDKC